MARRGSERIDRGGKASNSHKRAVIQERELALRMGGHVTPGSGNKEVKGDIRVRGICRIEAKTTKHKSFSVTLSMLDKIESAAIPHSEIPCMVIEFINDDGRPLKELAVIPVWALQQLIDNQK